MRIMFLVFVLAGFVLLAMRSLAQLTPALGGTSLAKGGGSMPAERSEARHGLKPRARTGGGLNAFLKTLLRISFR